MNVYALPVILQVIAVMVIIAEIFIPSFGLLTVAALGVFGYSLFLVFTTISRDAGFVFIGIDVIVVPVLIIWGIKILAGSSLSLKRELGKNEGVVSQSPGLDQYLGKKGIAVSDLRPAGTADIQGDRVDVVTDGEYIEKQTLIRVAGVTGNQIVVEKLAEKGEK